MDLLIPAEVGDYSQIYAEKGARDGLDLRRQPLYVRVSRVTLENATGLTGAWGNCEQAYVPIFRH